MLVSNAKASTPIKAPTTASSNLFNIASCYQCRNRGGKSLESRDTGKSMPTTTTTSPSRDNWEIPLNTWPRKLIAIVLILITSGILIYHTGWLFLAAWITRHGGTDPAIYERAIRYDPGNAEYHFILAYIYNYSTQYLNLDRARDEYEAAVRLNPDRSAHWLELSKYYEQEGNTQRCRFAMTKALETDPNYAQTHWSAANLYVRLGDTKSADFELRRSADLDMSYTTQVLDLVWRLYEDPDRIMSTDIPNNKDANLTALNYFISKKSDRGAELAWQRLKTFETKPPDRFNYVEYLVSQGRPHDAWNLFAGEGRSPASPFFNAGFDTEPLNGGFDWRFSSSEDAEARRDTTTVKDGLASFVVIFSGKQNVDYNQLWHWLPLDKGRAYNLKFWMKTDSISTNEGMFVEVDGQASEKQLGTTYWQEFTIPFTASSDLVTVRLRRVPSRKFDNLLKGKVWLDSFSIAAASS